MRQRLLSAWDVVSGALEVGRPTTKLRRWLGAEIGSGFGGRIRTQSPSRQWRVGSDGEKGVR
jgi:hypothetical protein